MPKLLITGASGFIGRNLVQQLALYHEVFAPMRTELDLLDQDCVQDYLRAHSFDVVIHSATVRSNRNVKAPPDLLSQNCRMFFNLARRNRDFGRLIYFGSGAEYGHQHFHPLMPEEFFDEHVPADDYGFSKYICAKAASVLGNAFELRLFAIFGPHEDWQVRFLSNACCRALYGLPVVIRQNVLFDFLDVRDLAHIVEWFIVNAPRHSHYNVCSGRPISLVALAQKVIAVSGKNLDIIVKREGLGREYSGDSRRLFFEMGGYALQDLDLSIAALYRWYEQRKETIDPRLLHFDA